jgi:hypothetical protein
MKFIKTFEGYFDPKSGSIVDTGDLLIPSKPNNSGEKLKFSKGSNQMIKPASAEKAVEELIRLLDVAYQSQYGDLGNVKSGVITNLNKFANWYSKCFSNEGTNTVPDVTKRLKAVLVELKSKDVSRSQVAIKEFFDNISSNLSDEKVADWLKSVDEFKRKDMAKFEQLCSYILA